MPNNCSAYGCSNTSNSKQNGKDEKLSFFRFPLSRPNLLKLWLLKMRRAQFKPTVHSRICSDHFTPDCILPVTYTKKKRLKEYAVPTIFCFSKPDQNSSHLEDQDMLDAQMVLIEGQDRVTSSPTIINVISSRNPNRSDAPSNIDEEPTYFQSVSTSSTNLNSQVLEPEILLEESPEILVASSISKPCTFDMAVQTDLGFSLVIDSLFEAHEKEELLKNRIEELESKVQERFSPKFMSNDHLRSLTGFDKETFFRIYDLLNITELLEGKKLAPEKQFLMFLMRLKTGITYEVLAYLFEIKGIATVCRTIQTVMDAVYDQFKTTIPNMESSDETIDEYSTFIVWVQRMLSKAKQ